jgi:Family of unknown function (DUF5759)
MEGVLSAKEVAALEKARADVKKETYRAILEQFSRKIRVSHELGQKTADLMVPPFVIGFPKYDLAKAVTYMARQLIKLGYTVELTGPVHLRVTWEARRVLQEDQEYVEDPVDILPGLMNLQKVAQKLRKK